MKIHRGLTFVLIATIASVVMAIVMIVAALALVGATFQALFAGNAAAAQGTGTALVVIGIMSGVIGLLLTGLKLAGHFFCLPSPDAYGSKPLALTTLILAATIVGCTLLNQALTIITLGSAGFGAAVNPMGFGGGAAVGNAGAMHVIATILGWIVILTSIAFFFVFLFYLRSLAQATGYTSLARNCVIYMITAPAGGIVLFLMSCIGMIVLAAGAAGAAQKQGGANAADVFATMGAGGIICAGLWILFYVAMLVWWILLIVQARNAVASRMGR